MFFNGLVKIYPSIADHAVFREFSLKFLPQLTGKSNGGNFVGGALAQAEWFKIIYENPNKRGLVKNFSAAELALCQQMIKVMHDLVFDVEHRAVMAQIVALLPNHSVTPHCDVRQLFTFTHRFNLVLETNSSTVITVTNPHTAQQININPQCGTFYELNNRVPHGAVNNGASRTSLFIVDFIHSDFPPLHTVDWQNEVTYLPNAASIDRDIIYPKTSLSENFREAN